MGVHRDWREQERAMAGQNLVLRQMALMLPNVAILQPRERSDCLITRYTSYQGWLFRAGGM